MSGPKKAVLSAVDLILAPFVFLGAQLLGKVRTVGVANLPVTRSALRKAGVFPIRDHYYEPLFQPDHLRYPLDQERRLPGIDWNEEGQLAMLDSFQTAEEIRDLPREHADDLVYHLNNTAFEAGDAEFWYHLLRKVKPGKIFEIGSGFSTLMAVRALARNRDDDPGYACRHVCIEPYEMPWLEQTGVEVVRRRIEDVDPALFDELGRDDILFIDSSHMIRPQGDVLVEYLEILPGLAPGVIVHVHDIFTPRDYSRQWVVDEVRFWNEQYLLEAFLTSNPDWEIIGALNFLQHRHHERLRARCPNLGPADNPGSFYMRKVG